MTRSKNRYERYSPPMADGARAAGVRTGAGNATA